MSYEQYLETYKQFWELKDKYDNKRKKTIKTLRKKHPKNIPLIKEELIKFDEKRKCINCGKSGGTLFEITKTHLRCRCNSLKPCQLNIDLKKSEHVDLEKMISEKVHAINDIKQDVLSYKLDLLFGLLNEEAVLNQFSILKEELNKNIEEKDVFQELYDKKNKILEIENAESSKENNFTLKETYIHDKQLELNRLISDFKKFMIEYKKTNNKSLLSDTIQLYKNGIIPLQDELRNLKYDEIFIEKKENNKGNKGNLKLMPEYIVHKTKISINNKMSIDNYKIKKNISKNSKK